MKQGISVVALAGLVMGLCSCANGATLDKVRKNVTDLQNKFTRPNTLFYSVNAPIYTKMVKEIEDFISDEGVRGTSESRQRKKDAARVARLWTLLVERMDKAFKQLQTYQTGVKSKGMIALEGLDYNKLTRAKLGTIKHLFVSLTASSVTEELNAIIDRSKQAQESCTLTACTQRFTQLQTLAIILLDAIAELDKSLEELSAMVPPDIS